MTTAEMFEHTPGVVQYRMSPGVERMVQLLLLLRPLRRAHAIRKDGGQVYVKRRPRCLQHVHNVMLPAVPYRSGQGATRTSSEAEGDRRSHHACGINELAGFNTLVPDS